MFALNRASISAVADIAAILSAPRQTSVSRTRVKREQARPCLHRPGLKFGQQPVQSDRQTLVLEGQISEHAQDGAEDLTHDVAQRGADDRQLPDNALNRVKER